MSNEIPVKAKILSNAVYSKRYIGRSRYDFNNTLAIAISDFKIYNRVLNSEEIEELYNANIYTRYIITYYDEENGTIFDMIMIGGGGGGSPGGGGGAGKLVYVENAKLYKDSYDIKVGRGGAGNYTTQLNSKGNFTSFHSLIADGGGSFNIDNGIGGSGSGNGTSSDNIPQNYSFLNTNNIYLKGNDGYVTNGGGGGAGTEGQEFNGGNGTY